MDELLFNGAYYRQQVLWREAQDSTLRDRLEKARAECGDGPLEESARLLESEGPKYQYGNGCLADGIIGGWMAAIYGVPTPLDPSNVRRTLKSIFENNFRSDLWEHACLQRPGYALGHEPGLLLCTWPNGDAPTLPFPYSDEVWTGLEYQVASHLITEGMVDEGLTVVRAARSRYDGRVRNPFNEYECGSYYARAMSSYALLGALSGFRYSAVDRTLRFGPRLPVNRSADAEFRSFFSTESAFGTITLGAEALTVSVIEGALTVDRLLLTREGQTEAYDWKTAIGAGHFATMPLRAARHGPGSAAAPGGAE